MAKAAEAKTAETVETAAEVKQETKPVKPVQAETEYTSAELAANAEAVFKTRKECVVAALRAANVTKTTVSKAKEIVDKFLKKEVK